MLQKSLLILCLGLSSLVLVGCKATLKEPACVSFPPDGGLQCYDPVKKEYFFVKYDDSKGYVAFSPQSAKRLFDQCFKKKQGGLLSEPESEELEPEESNSTPEEESVLVDWDELRESYPEYYQDDVLDETSPSDIDLDQDL